jgi:hypothetical protein
MMEEAFMLLARALSHSRQQMMEEAFMLLARALSHSRQQMMEEAFMLLARALSHSRQQMTFLEGLRSSHRAIHSPNGAEAWVAPVKRQ